MTRAAGADEERHRGALAGAERFLNAWHGTPRAREQLEALALAAEEGERGDRYGEGDRLQRLEGRVAALLGKEAAVFMPSGTMCNVAATLVHCRPGDEILAHHSAHIIAREGGSLLCFVRDPDGYRIELIERSDY